MLLQNSLGGGSHVAVESETYARWSGESPLFMRVRREIALLIPCSPLFLKRDLQNLGKIPRFSDCFRKLPCFFPCYLRYAFAAFSAGLLGWVSSQARTLVQNISGSTDDAPQWVAPGTLH